LHHPAAPCRPGTHCDCGADRFLLHAHTFCSAGLRSKLANTEEHIFMRININADIGESYGKFTIGNDSELMTLIGSANIACGMHAGDPSIMVRTIGLAKEHGVSIGAHPGFNDIWGFGRRQIRMNPKDLEYLVTY